MESASARVSIRNRLGLHARPAMAFIDAANAFESDVHIHKGAQVVDGKSIMQVMMLAATQGTELEIRAEGDDAQAAIKVLSELVNRGFDED